MPKVFIEEIHIVGMYHYGARQLELNHPHRLVRDRQNVHDVHAIRVVKNGDISQRTVAYVARYHAGPLSQLFDLSFVVNGVVYLKAKSPVHRVGRKPTQSCTIAMRVREEHIDQVQAIIAMTGCPFSTK